MPTYASYLAPVCRRFIGVAEEATPGTAVLPTFTWPMKTFTPKDKYTRLEDDAWRNSMAGLFNIVDGVRIADLSMGGPHFADATPYGLLSILGDYWQAVSTGTAGTATTLNSSYTAGGTTISTVGNTGLTAGATFAVGALGTTAEEVRTVVGTPTGSGPYTVTMNAPMYQNHASGAAVTPYSGTIVITHNFALLNSGTGAGGFSAAQPRTLTWTDYTGLGGTTFTNTIGARAYAYTCLSEMSLTGTATSLVNWDAKAIALASALAASAPTASPSSVKPQASWLSTVTMGSTQEFNNVEWKLTMARKAEGEFTNSGQQDPFAIARGLFTAALSFNFTPAVDESEFLFYLNNTQNTLVISASNGLSGANASTLTITANQLGFTDGGLNDSKMTFGYDLTAQCIANSTNVGPSGGLSPLVVSVTNQVTSY